MGQRRRPGEGQVDRLPSGRFRVRLVIDGARTSLGTFATEAEAREVLDGARVVVSGGVRRTHAHTLDVLADRVFTRMRLDGHRGMRAKRARWNNHVSPALGGMDFRKLTRADVRGLERRLATKLGRRTVPLVIGMVAQVLDAAIEDGEISSNPARLPRRSRLARHAAEEEDAWTYLTVAEQRALLECPAIPPHDRFAIAVMMGAGLRVGELVSLRLADVSVGEDPRVVVRYGSPPNGPTKTGKTRVVPLFGLALDAMREWLEVLPVWCKRNRSGTAFPALRGGFRRTSWLYAVKAAKAKPTPWARYLAAAGITRRVRVHDLRHTCAASLVSGFWGRPWQLLEVRDLLGHTNIAMTQRYAHLAPASLAATAKVTGVPRSGPSARPERDESAGIQAGFRASVNDWLGCLKVNSTCSQSVGVRPSCRPRASPYDSNSRAESPMLASAS